MPYAYDVTEADFDTAVLARSREVPVLVDFWAPWCGPCRVLKPLLEKLAADYGGRFELAKLNSDEAPSVSARYAVRSIPAVKLFVDGEVVDEPSSLSDLMLPDRLISRSEMNRGDFGWSQVVFS